MTTFVDLGVPEDLAAVLSARDITTPFPIQTATIPDLLGGRDLCGRAPTGSGKTIAFGLPLIARVKRAGSKRPRALVLAPTRELAAQIQRELAPLAQARRRRVFAIYGGVGYEPQRRALRKGVDVLVACPGRLEDLMEQRIVDLSEVETVVIDEADRMADMGFLPAVRRILDATAPKRQTILFSATLDGDVAVLTRAYQHDPARHEIADAGDDGINADHRFETISSGDRLQRLVHVVGTEGPTIVFCRTRRGAEKVAKKLGQANVKAAPIHGGRSQNQRDRALASFTRGHVDALVATDVAARGIHVDDVACVVHFDPPEDAKAYLHRSGRTARKGASGVVISLISHDQQRESRKLQRELGIGPAGNDPAPRPHGNARRKHNQGSGPRRSTSRRRPNRRRSRD